MSPANIENIDTLLAILADILNIQEQDGGNLMPVVLTAIIGRHEDGATDILKRMQRDDLLSTPKAGKVRIKITDKGRALLSANPTDSDLDHETLNSLLKTAGVVIRGSFTESMMRVLQACDAKPKAGPVPAPAADVPACRHTGQEVKRDHVALANQWSAQGVWKQFHGTCYVPSDVLRWALAFPYPSSNPREVLRFQRLAEDIQTNDAGHVRLCKDARDDLAYRKTCAALPKLVALCWMQEQGLLGSKSLLEALACVHADFAELITRTAEWVITNPNGLAQNGSELQVSTENRDLLLDWGVIERSDIPSHQWKFRLVEASAAAIASVQKAWRERPLLPTTPGASDKSPAQESNSELNASKPKETEDAENDNSSKEVGKITRELRSQMIQGCLQIMDIMIREHQWPYPMNVIPGSFIHVVASVVMGLSKTKTFDKLIGTLRTDGFIEKAGARLDFGGSLPYKILKDKTRDVFDEETARRIVRECLGTEEEKESLIRLLKTRVFSNILYPPQAGQRSLTDEEKRVLAAHQRAQQKKDDGLLDTESLAVIQIIASNAVATRNALKAAGLLEQLEGTWVVSEAGLSLVADQDLLNQEEKEHIDANFAPPAPTPKSGIRKPADEIPPKPKPPTPVVPPPPPPPPTAPTPVDPLEQLRQRLAASVETTDRFAQIQEELAQARLHAQTQQRVVEQVASDLENLQGELDRLQREIAKKTAAKTTQDAAAREAEEKAAQLAASLSNLDISKEAEKQNRLRKAIEALEALSALDEA